MATNCPQQVNPRACRSALSWRTADSNSKREKSWRTCENILQNRFKAEPPEFEIGFLGPNLNLSEAQLFSCDLLRSQFGQQCRRAYLIVLSERKQGSSGASTR